MNVFLMCFFQEQTTEFRYIALELCRATLREFIEHPQRFDVTLQPSVLMQQALSGLAHLHALDIGAKITNPTQFACK